MNMIMGNKNTTKKIILSGILIAISTVLGSFSIPILGAKVSPVQHFINVISAVILGPVYGILCAFVSSLLRNILGTGSLLAFPGSMVGVFFAGIMYRRLNNMEVAIIGEVVGTGVIGALLAYPLAAFVLGKEVALLIYVVPFTISSLLGSIIAYVILKSKAISNEICLYVQKLLIK